MEGNSTVLIHLEPDDVWEYCLDHKEQLRDNLVCIAEEPTNHIGVYVTSEGSRVMISVQHGDTTVFESVIVSKGDAAVTAWNLYKDYFGFEKPAEKQEDDDVYNEEIAERELELYDGMYEFLSTLLDFDASEFMQEDCDKAIESMIGDLCLLLAEDYGISVRRPQMVKHGGVEVFTEYPYDGAAGLVDDNEVIE